MATREIRMDTDEVLRKKAKEIDVIDNKIRELALDMLDTMYKYDGCSTTSRNSKKNNNL